MPIHCSKNQIDNKQICRTSIDIVWPLFNF